MRFLRRFRSWFEATLLRSRMDREMDIELRFHIEACAEDLIRRGTAREEAMRLARLEFGGIDRAKEECREIRRASFLETVAQDLRFGARTLRKNPGSTAVAVLTVALGIGANTAIYSVVSAVLFKQLPYPHPETLVWVAEHYPPIGDVSFSWPDFADCQKQNQVFDAMAAYQNVGYNMTGSAVPLHLQATQVSAGYFGILGTRVALGRMFSDSDDGPGANPTVILTDNFWRAHFSADPQALGKPLILDGRSYTVVGVLPADFWNRSHVDIFVPIGLSTADPDVQNRDEHPAIFAIARLKPGVSIEQARANLNTISSRLALEYPKSDTDVTPVVKSLRQAIVADSQPTLYVLFFAVIFVLLTACANVANLLLVRGSARQKEIALRSALGASRGRIIAQALTESILLALLGGGLGLFFAAAGIRPLLALAPQSIPRLNETHVSLSVLAFATGVSLLAGIVFGLIPALQLSRSSALENLKQATRSATAAQSRTRLGSGVLVAEVGLSLLLATGAGLMIRSMIRVEQSSLGFEPARILTLGVSLPPAKYQKPADQLRFFEDAIARIQSLPGVRAAAAVRCLHMAGECWSSGYTPEDRIGLSRGISFNSNVISPRYIEALGIPVIQGRAFTEHDTAQSQPVAIVNQTLSRKTMAEWHRDW